MRPAGEESPLSCPTKRQKTKFHFITRRNFMSTESYRGFKFRYCNDVNDSGKVRVYVESGINSSTEHYHKGTDGAPPRICFKEDSKPSSYSEARSLAHRWADMNT
jgi:hypothetical protein